MRDGKLGMNKVELIMRLGTSVLFFMGVLLFIRTYQVFFTKAGKKYSRVRDSKIERFWLLLMAVTSVILFLCVLAILGRPPY